MDSKTRIRLYSMLAALLITSSALSGYKGNGKPIEKPSISEKHSDFNKFKEYRLTKAKAELCYKGENISIFINKETNEITRYIYNKDLLKSEVYELDTGDMVLYIPMNMYELSQGLEYYNDLIEKSFVFDFTNIGDYIEGETCKRWYTEREIEEIESKLLDFVLKMKENTKKLVKLK